MHLRVTELGDTEQIGKRLAGNGLLVICVGHHATGDLAADVADLALQVAHTGTRGCSCE